MSKIVLQTSKEKPRRESIDLLMRAFPGWKYVHFNDKECIDFLLKNPIGDFPNPENKFRMFLNGAHKADFFRYYFLYLNGGFFVDSDLIIYEDMNLATTKNTFISCYSPRTLEYLNDSIFQGLLYAEPKSKIIYDAIKSIYEMPQHKIDMCNENTANGYLTLVKDFYYILKENYNPGVKMYESEMFGYLGADGEVYSAGYIIDQETHKKIGIHFNDEKRIYDSEIFLKIVRS